MRVSYIGSAMKDKPLAKVRAEARKTAMCSHDHPEGIKGAVAVATIIWLAENGHSKEDIKEYFQHEYPPGQYFFAMDDSLNAVHNEMEFDATCQVTVPLAIRCFLATENFMDMMALIDSIVCDTDTIGAIAGSIAESFYGNCTGSVESDKALIREIVSNDATRAMFEETGKVLPLEIRLFEEHTLPKENSLSMKKNFRTKRNRKYELIRILEKHKII